MGLGLGARLRGRAGFAYYALLLLGAAVLGGAMQWAFFSPNPAPRAAIVAPSPKPGVAVDEWAVVSENADRMCAQYKQRVVEIIPPRAGSSMEEIDCGSPSVTRYRIQVLHRSIILPHATVAQD